MKKLIKTSLYALILGVSAGAGVVYAEEVESPDLQAQTDACNGGGGKGCSGHIPINVTVAKHCYIKTTPAINLAANGTGFGQFAVVSNADYKLHLKTQNGSQALLNGDATKNIPLTIKTTAGANSYNLNQWYSGIPKSQVLYNVSVSTSGIDLSTKEAGIYKDTYLIDVDF
ncbi:hypothetical protein [Acinetobacter sp. GSS19]|uniref:hypothetical protein n=1 Tax=Acinetobacter sp. GSS19 TaxID=3020716 RepID=UPI002361E984|nr:hypothetical protein [Acinetobacter sp. GSS19]